MSERYSRLFALPENLYAVGSPVVIAAGTLLKDNQTGRIVAQLKMQSISNKTIKAVKVKLDLFDTAGNSLEESVVHDYLDLNVSRDGEFGQKNPIMVPNITARSYRVSVTEVVFRDYSVWATDGGNWESLSRHFPLVFEDPELRKQYEIKFGAGSIYEAKTDKDLWYCTCGAINHDGEMCHICHNTLLALQSVDMAELERAKNTRLEENARAEAEREKQAAEEQAAKKAAKEELYRKISKVLKIVIPVACAVLAFVILQYAVIIPNSKYKDAVSLMEAGQYGKAIVAFEALDGYKDSIALIEKCTAEINYAEQKAEEDAANQAYQEALVLIQAQRFEEAYLLLLEHNKFENCSNLLEKFRFLLIESVVTDDNDKKTYIRNEYDNQGRRTLFKYTCEYFESNSTYVYNSNGLLIKSVDEYLFNDGEEYTIYSSYNDHGDTVESVTEYRNPGQDGDHYTGEIIENSYEYTYNEEGKAISYVKYKNGKRVAEGYYEYDSYGNLISEEYDTYTRTYQHEYDEAGNIIVTKEYYNNELNHIYTYAYDVFGNISTEEQENFRWDGFQTTQHTYQLIYLP